MPASRVKLAIAELLKAEGYVEDVATAETGPGKKVLSVKLKYFQGKPVIEIDGAAVGAGTPGPVATRLREIYIAESRAHAI